MFLMDNDMIYESENFCAPPSSSVLDTLRRAGLFSGGLRVSFPLYKHCPQLAMVPQLTTVPQLALVLHNSIVQLIKISQNKLGNDRNKGRYRHLVKDTL